MMSSLLQSVCFRIVTVVLALDDVGDIRFPEVMKSRAGRRSKGWTFLYSLKRVDKPLKVTHCIGAFYFAQ